MNETVSVPASYGVQTEWDKADWRKVAAKVRPDLSDEAYNALWDEFQVQKADGEFKE